MTLRRYWLGSRSAGIRVARAAFRAIYRADQARTRADWSAAAAGYRRALEIEPQLAHIWIQLGHVAKEAGATAEAEAAYLRAATLDPAAVEPHIRIGHMRKASGEPVAAARQFVAALRRAPQHLEATAELARTLPERHVDAALWDAAIACLKLDRPGPRRSPAVADASLLVDVTDLLAYLAVARVPSGIQRLQIEILLALLSPGSGVAVSLCVYSSARHGWVLLPGAMVAAFCGQTLRSGDTGDLDWQRDLRAIYAHIAVSAAIAFGRDCVLLNLGTTWSEPGYLTDVEAERARSDMRYVAFVFDLIPVLHPQWFAPSLVAEFGAWIRAVLRTADGVITISEASAADLSRFAADRGQALRPGSIRVVRLDGDVARHDSGADDARILAGLGLEPANFVLFVSTIEPRKNHIGAFAAWLRLIAELGEQRVPALVCVGGKGWLNDDVHALLRVEARLRRTVRLVSGASDEVLAALYRQCRFTLYPSLYEGWGLPVSEALSYGKVPAIGRSSSLPEAGGGHAVYFDAADPASIAAAVGPLITDRERLARLEAAIADSYRPRAWSEIADQVVTEARAIASGRGAAPA